MNRGKTVTTSPPREKFSTSSLSKAFFVGSDKVGGIVEVFDIVPPIPFWAIPGPTHKVFDSEAFTFSDSALIEKAVNFEGLLAVGVTFYKYKGGLLRVEPVEGILGRGWGWLKLSHREDRVDPPVARYLQLVGKATDFLNDPEGADIQLG